ncbi:VirK/YbjX family protein [Dongshaea marina]|uniref:VirK/YbjX family protein n=1 Tax=Dongshaea marina TaxID=2047966 RepID=UPI00131ED312|nr:VirK/YbjX family protein [Dongshaea marina]
MKYTEFATLGSRSKLIFSLPQLSSFIYPGIQGVKKIRYGGRFCLWGVLHLNILHKMVKLFSDKQLYPLLESQPRLLEKPLKPYLSVKWKRSERAGHIRQHYTLMQNIFAERLYEIFCEGGFELMQFNAGDGGMYRIQLCYDGGLSREGDLTIRLTDAQNQRIYSLACSFSHLDKSTLFIGALQGPSESIRDRQELTRQLTKSLYGLRPKALMIEVAQMLATTLGFEQILAISNKGHIYQALRYFGSLRGKVSFDYDALWHEFGGEKISSSFYRLPVHPERRPLESIKSKKRAQYRNRYQWLDNVEDQIKDKGLIPIANAR